MGLVFIIFVILVTVFIPIFVVTQYRRIAPIEVLDSGRNLLQHLSNRIFYDIEDLYPEIRILSCCEDTFTIDDVGATILIETNTSIQFKLYYRYSDDEYILVEV